MTEKIIIHTLNAAESEQAQTALFKKGYQWPASGPSIADALVFEALIKDKFLSTSHWMCSADPLKYAIDNEHQYFKLPRDKIPFMIAIGMAKKNSTVGHHVAMIRKLRGIKQIELAKMLGITQTHLSRIETSNGKEGNPSMDLLNRISEILEAKIIMTPQ